jgi:hypothetical protein
MAHDYLQRIQKEFPHIRPYEEDESMRKDYFCPSKRGHYISRWQGNNRCGRGDGGMIFNPKRERVLPTFPKV